MTRTMDWTRDELTMVIPIISIPFLMVTMPAGASMMLLAAIVAADGLLLLQVTGPHNTGPVG